MSLIASRAIKYLTLKEAARRFPPIEGRHPHVSAIWRQARKGILALSGKRIKLRHIRSGRRILIPEDAIAEFLDDLARADAVYFDTPAATPAPEAPHATPALRAKQIAAAEAACKKRGI